MWSGEQYIAIDPRGLGNERQGQGAIGDDGLVMREECRGASTQTGSSRLQRCDVALGGGTHRSVCSSLLVAAGASPDKSWPVPFEARPTFHSPVSSILSRNGLDADATLEVSPCQHMEVLTVPK